MEVGVEGEGHTCWKQAKGEKIDYMDVDPFPVSLLGGVVEVVVLGEDEG